MELQNKAQGKKFVASFLPWSSIGARWNILDAAKPYGKIIRQYARAYDGGISFFALIQCRRTISSTQIEAQHSPAGGQPPFETFTVRTVRTTPAPVECLPIQHQFREQGKSQKSLDRQNPPMTIDQVRELLKQK